MTQLSIIKRLGGRTIDILTQASSFPYTPTATLVGIAAMNDGADTVTIVVNDGEKNITINLTTNGRSGQWFFKEITSINVTAGTTFQIQLVGGD